MQERYIRTEKCPEVFYRKLGQGAPVLLIHGFPDDGNLWRRVMPLLSETCTVIVPDLPGTGKSIYSGGGISIEELADSMLSILHTERISKVVVAGHSMGGYIALAMAANCPEIMAGLSLVHSTSQADSAEKKQQREKVIRLIRNGGKDTFIKGMIPGLFAPHFQTKDPEGVAMQIGNSLKLASGTLTGFYEAMINRPERTFVLSEARFPVQFISGKEDSVVPFDITMKLSDLPSVSFVSVYEEVGHMSMLERPESLAADLEAFSHYCLDAALKTTL